MDRHRIEEIKIGDRLRVVRGLGGNPPKKGEPQIGEVVVVREVIARLHTVRLDGFKERGWHITRFEFIDGPMCHYPDIRFDEKDLMRINTVKERLDTSKKKYSPTNIRVQQMLELENICIEKGMNMVDANEMGKALVETDGSEVEMKKVMAMWINVEDVEVTND